MKGCKQMYIKKEFAFLCSKFTLDLLGGAGYFPEGCSNKEPYIYLVVVFPKNVYLQLQ